LKLTAIGADVSGNDVCCSDTLIKNLERDIPELLNVGAEKAALTNITGDDVVISAFVRDENLEAVNAGIIEVLRKNAENLGDIEGVSVNPQDAGEGVSYAQAKIKEDRYPDAIIIAFDTYGGESIVGLVADNVMKAAVGMDNVTDVGGGPVDGTYEIPGVGYISESTDDLVVAATIEDMASVGVVAGAMVGAALGNKNVFLVRRGTPSDVIPGSVIMSVTAYMNGNVLDLAVPLSRRMMILGV
jgi:hypothetical protein